MLMKRFNKLCVFTCLLLRTIRGQSVWQAKLSTERFQSIASFAFAIHRVNLGKTILICEDLGIAAPIKRPGVTIQCVSRPVPCQSFHLKHAISTITT